MINTRLLYKFLRYSTQGAIVYIVFRKMSWFEMKDYEVFLLTLIILLACALLENLFKTKESKQNLVNSSCACDAGVEGYETGNEQMDQIVHQCVADATAKLEKIGENDGDTTGTGASDGAVISESTKQSDLVKSSDGGVGKLNAGGNAGVLGDVQNNSIADANADTDKRIKEAEAYLARMKERAAMQSIARKELNDAQKVLQQAQELVEEKRKLAMGNAYRPATSGQRYDNALADGLRHSRGNRGDQGVIGNDMKYTDYGLIPVADGYKSKDYEYGYSFLPPEKWYPQPPRPPVCVTDKRCPVCPVSADGTNADLKEYNKSLRVTPPNMINVDYVEEKMNSGR